MTSEELKQIKEMAMKYSDPIRGKMLALIAYIEILEFEIEKVPEDTK
jgi:hypothetical protein